MASRSSRTPSASQLEGSGNDHSTSSPCTAPGSGRPGYIKTTTSDVLRSSTVTARGVAADVSIPSSCSVAATAGLIVSEGVIPALVATSRPSPMCVRRWAPSWERPALCLHMNRTVLGRGIWGPLVHDCLECSTGMICSPGEEQVNSVISGCTQYRRMSI